MTLPCSADQPPSATGVASLTPCLPLASGLTVPLLGRNETDAIALVLKSERRVVLVPGVFALVGGGRSYWLRRRARLEGFGLKSSVKTFPEPIVPQVLVSGHTLN